MIIYRVMLIFVKKTLVYKYTTESNILYDIHKNDLD